MTNGSAEDKLYSPNMEIGLRDGSLLQVRVIRIEDDQYQFHLACGVHLKGIRRSDVVFLRSWKARTHYLSDMEDADYRHVAYLDIPWKYSRDRNVLEGVLRVEGVRYAKGLGVHSASRLTYDLTQFASKYKKFKATVAIDAAAGDCGSVVFRVYLKTAGEWHKIYSSPVVRGGESPRPIAIELGEASQIALLTEFADRGDELDYANWLDARFE